jgi:hypothetical protein
LHLCVHRWSLYIDWHIIGSQLCPEFEQIRQLHTQESTPQFGENSSDNAPQLSDRISKRHIRPLSPLGHSKLFDACEDGHKRPKAKSSPLNSSSPRKKHYNTGTPHLTMALRPSHPVHEHLCTEEFLHESPSKKAAASPSKTSSDSSVKMPVAFSDKKSIKSPAKKVSHSPSKESSNSPKKRTTASPHQPSDSIVKTPTHSLFKKLLHSPKIKSAAFQEPPIDSPCRTPFNYSSPKHLSLASPQRLSADSPTIPSTVTRRRRKVRRPKTFISEEAEASLRGASSSSEQSALTNGLPPMTSHKSRNAAATDVSTPRRSSRLHPE